MNIDIHITGISSIGEYVSLINALSGMKPETVQTVKLIKPADLPKELFSKTLKLSVKEKTDLTCVNCGKTFKPKTKNSTCCSDKCSKQLWYKNHKKKIKLNKIDPRTGRNIDEII